MRSRFFFTMVVISAVSIPAQETSAPQPWMNPRLSPDQRADLVVHQLTLPEKIQLVHGIGWGPLRPGDPVPPDNNGGAGEVQGIPRLGIPSLQQADSAVGVRMAAAQSRYATLLPSVLGAAASWDVKAAHLYGDIIGRELRAQGYNQSIGGGVNLARDPRNGRLFEYPGEDPLLAGVTVGHVIQGIQANKVMADIKHYAFNDQETGRTVVDVHISRKSAHESDLLAFELGIRIGQPSSVMCSYNKVEGDWSCENKWLLNDVLKGEWKFPGFVVSDWEATHSTTKAALAGLDMEMPGSQFFGTPLEDAVRNGKVPQARLDDMVHRLLRSMFAAGVIDDPSLPRKVVDPFRGRDDAQQIEEESIVLLKNNRGALPLVANRLQRVVVIGAHADVGVISGGGSAQVDAPGGNAISPDKPTKWGEAVYFPSSPLRYIREHAPNAQVSFDAGTDPAMAAQAARGADAVLIFADQYMSEGGDAPTLALPGNQNALIAAVAKANPHTLVILETGNPVSMPWIDDVQGVLEAWYPGIGGGQAIANVLFGSVDPSGKLPITFPRSEKDLPHPRIFGMTYKTPANGGLPEHWVSEEKTASFPADYTEGVRFGYKWFESEQKQPLFPFGFGLSYTHFTYDDLQIDSDKKQVHFRVRNDGQRSGTEVAQAYVQLPPSSGEKFMRLAGWGRVTLAPGASHQVTVQLEPLALASWNEPAEKWDWTHGDYTVKVGRSSADIALSGHLRMQ
ncbi:glycoside hydrolase family 3 C-terminal domain-containing protein [Edaphobacter sp. 12200R-103]|uniref:beta-glucosidase n=1 Tax=Edaphobacter sp. 12200R-103 TaxID=2703788 RepID=UPI001EE43972|nr:glycoside hydrolase family 3 C-terminal domain-containing protein [Edaphobacter sp. 12200R-103]